MADTHTRLAKRAPVTLKIKFKSSTLDQFIERYSVDVSHGGIFIRTKDPLAVGTNMRFEFQLKDATPLIRGEGTVVWTREHDPSRTGVAPGMGVRFDRLGDGSQEVLDKILAQKSSKGGGHKGPSFNEQPTKVAPSPLLAGLNKESSQPSMGNLAPKSDSFGSSGVEHTGTDATPLPTPMPFHSDADDFPEEAFEEATKVASLDALAARSLLDDLDDEEDDDPVDELAERRAREEEEEEAAAAAKKAAEAKKAEQQAAAAKKAEQQAAAAKKAAEAKKTADAAPAKKAEQRKGKDKDTAPAKKAEERKKAAAAVPPPETASGSGGTYAMLAVLILAVGGGTYWYLNKDKGADKVASSNGAASVTPTPVTPAPETPKTPDTPKLTAADNVPTPVVPPPVVEVFKATISAEPKDAIIEIAGATAVPEEPGSYSLDKGKDHTVRVSAPGFLPQEVTVAEASPDATIQLAPKPRILRVTSTPEGAKVRIKGRPIKGVTPLDVIVSKRLARPRLAIVVSMKGYKSQKIFTSGTEGFVEGDESMVSDISATMVKQVVVARQPKVDKPKVDKPKVDKPKVDKPKVDKPKVDKPKVDKPKVDKPKVDEPKDDKPLDKAPDESPDEGSTGPKPDWLN